MKIELNVKISHQHVGALIDLINECGGEVQITGQENCASDKDEKPARTRARITNEMRANIVSMRRNNPNMSYKSIAHRFGISATAVSRIIKQEDED